MGSLSFETWVLFLTALAGIGLGFFVYVRRNRQNPANVVWFRLSLAIAVWALVTGFMINSPDLSWALVWARIAQIAFTLIPVFFLQYVLMLVNANGRGEQLSIWNTRLGGVFAILSSTSLTIKDLQLNPPFNFYPVAGPFYGLFVLWFAASFITGIGFLMRAYRELTGYRRSQIRYVIAASLFALTAFLSMMPLAFGVSSSPLTQGLLVFYGLILYAILRWRLMGITVVIKNTLIYTSLYSILVGLFVVVVVFMGQLLFYGPQALDKRVLGMCVVALSIVTALVRPLDAWLTKLTDKLLFQQKFEWQKTLKDASRGMSKVTSIDRLLRLMAHFIGMRVRVSHVGVLYRSSDYYSLKVSRGREKRPIGLTVTRDNPLVEWLEDKKEVLSRDEVQNWLRNERVFPHRTVLRRGLEDICREMDLLGAQVCVPAYSKSQMFGFLVLGEKLSGDPYSQEDLDLLLTLANEGAIALENAQLYEQLFQRMHQIEELYQREHRLFIHTAIALAAAVDARDPYTHGHTERCTAYAMEIAEEIGQHPELYVIPRFKESLRVAALLHDIGKIGTPDHILRKNGKLTPKEFKKIQEHPTVGAIILQPIKGMEEVAKVVKAHQERFDGRGYPDGLRGNEIPLMARIIAVADSYDAMTTDRPYRKRLPEAVAIKEIETHSGSQFDPTVVMAFMKAYRKGHITMRPVEAEEMLA